MKEQFKDYEYIVNKFNKTHGLKFSFEQYEAERKKASHMREFFLKGNGELNLQNYVYRKMFEDLFKEAVENSIMRKGKIVDHSALFKDYELMMSDYRYYCKLNEIDPPDKNGGWKSGVKIIEAIENKISRITENKNDYVREQYVKRTLRLRDMRADLASMVKDGKEVTAEELSRAILYKRALEQTISGRSFLWKATHWFHGPAEQRDLKSLNEFIAQYSDKDIYKAAEAFADENVMQMVKSNLETAKTEIKAKELLKPRRLKTADQANERMKELKVYDHVHKQILGLLDKSPIQAVIKENVSRGTFLGENMGTIRHMWNNFEKAATPEEKGNVIENYTKKIFNDTFKHLGTTFKVVDAKDRIVAAQKITDIVLNQYSPATFSKEYDKFADNYLVSNEAFMDGLMKQHFNKNDLTHEELKDFMSEVKTEITTPKEKLNISKEEISSDKTAKSEKLIDERKIENRVKVN